MDLISEEMRRFRLSVSYCCSCSCFSISKLSRESLSSSVGRCRSSWLLQATNRNQSPGGNGRATDVTVAA
jgi:hypothetical protein